ncbi:MAG: ribbon-helix-helix protein, CopG family [Myxococcales bacterium]|nr:ribbon-helix-helix protein, CopG family [Myxococcales bacterium]
MFVRQEPAMQTKLTLRLDDELVRRAKAHARARGRSVSAMVADYFAQLDAPPTDAEIAMTPRVRSLYGALADVDVDEADHRDHLARKHA